MLEGADHGGSEFFTERILDIIEEFIPVSYTHLDVYKRQI